MRLRFKSVFKFRTGLFNLKANCMTKTITQDNLIRFIYNETTAEESSLIDEALSGDFQLMELFDQLIESKNQLDMLVTSPKKIMVDSVMAYSKDTAPMEHMM